MFRNMMWKASHHVDKYFLSAVVLYVFTLVLLIVLSLLPRKVVLLPPLDTTAFDGTLLHVMPERRVGPDWLVPWTYQGLLTMSYSGTQEEARRLYAVLVGAQRQAERSK